jgi:hypothetical protein
MLASEPAALTVMGMTRLRFEVNRSVLGPTVVTPSEPAAAQVGAGDGVGEAVGEGVGDGVGDGVGEALGDGVGVGEGGVPVCTTKDGGDAELVVPAVLVAVTTDCKVNPTSEAPGV